MTVPKGAKPDALDTECLEERMPFSRRDEVRVNKRAPQRGDLFVATPGEQKSNKMTAIKLQAIGLRCVWPPFHGNSTNKIDSNGLFSRLFLPTGVYGWLFPNCRSYFSSQPD